MRECTHNGRSFRILNVIDEYTRECLATRVARQLTMEHVQECLTQLFCQRGMPVHLRCDVPYGGTDVQLCRKTCLPVWYT